MSLPAKNIQLSEKIQFLNQMGEFATHNGENIYFPNSKYRNVFHAAWIKSDERMIKFVNDIIKDYGLYPYLQCFVNTPEQFKQTLYSLTTKNQ